MRYYLQAKIRHRQTFDFNIITHVIVDVERSCGIAIRTSEPIDREVAKSRTSLKALQAENSSV